MKKHDEGYTLVLVLVVMIVMCLAAVSVLSISASNLHNQQDSIAQMQDKFEAQGKIEQFWMNLQRDIDETSTDYEEWAYILSESTVVSASGSEDALVSNIGMYQVDGRDNSVFISFTASGSDSVCISCVIELKSEFPVEFISEDGGYYSIVKPELAYASYEISVPEGGAEG